MLRTTTTAYPGRPVYQPTDQLAVIPYNQNRRERRRAAREGQGQGSQMQYVNTVSDPNRNPNPNPILLRQPTPQTITLVQHSAIIPTSSNNQGERSDWADQKRPRGNQQTMFSYYGPKPGSTIPGPQTTTSSGSTPIVRGQGGGVVAAIGQAQTSLTQVNKDMYAAFCHGCGGVHPGFRTPEMDHSGCKFWRTKHPDYNYDPCDWAESFKGKIYIACGVNKLDQTKLVGRNLTVEARKQMKRKTPGDHPAQSTSSGEEYERYPLAAQLYHAC